MNFPKEKYRINWSIIFCMNYSPYFIITRSKSNCVWTPFLSLFNKRSLWVVNDPLWLHWYCKTLTNSLTFWECKTQTSTVNRRLHSVSDKSKVLVEDLPSLPSKSLKLMSTRDLERWSKKKSELSPISSLDQLSTTSQNGSWTDKRIQRTVPGLNSFPTP